MFKHASSTRRTLSAPLSVVSAFLVLALSGCQSPAERIAARCKAYGFEVGTDHYAQCVMNERQAEAITDAAIINAHARPKADVTINNQ